MCVCVCVCVCTSLFIHPLMGISLMISDVEHLFSACWPFVYIIFGEMSIQVLCPFFFFKNLFIYLFLAVLGLRFCGGLSLVAVSRGHSSSRCTGLSQSRPLSLRSTSSRRAGSVVVAHGPSCSAAHGIFPDQGSNPCPLHWQADCQPLCHQGSPFAHFLIGLFDLFVVEL